MITVCTLPEVLTPNWSKTPLADLMVINVADLLECVTGWQCRFHCNVQLLSVEVIMTLGSVHGLCDHDCTAALSMTCRTCDVLVSPMLQLRFFMIEHTG